MFNRHKETARVDAKSEQIRLPDDDQSVRPFNSFVILRGRRIQAILFPNLALPELNGKMSTGLDRSVHGPRGC